MLKIIKANYMYIIIPHDAMETHSCLTSSYTVSSGQPQPGTQREGGQTGSGV